MAIPTSADAAYSLNRYLYSHSGAVVSLRANDAGGTTADFSLIAGVLDKTSGGGSVATWLASLTAATAAFVAQLYDHSGNVNNTNVPATADQPLLVEGDADLGNVAEFDGTDDWMRPGTGTLVNGTDETVAMVGKSVADQPSGLHLWFGSSTSHRLYVGQQGTTWYCRLGNMSLTTPGTSDTAPHWIQASDISGQVNFYVNGSVLGTGTNSSTSAITNEGIGAFNNGSSSFWNGRMAECYFWDKAFTAQERIDLNDFMEDFYFGGGGLAIPIIQHHRKQLMAGY